MNRSARRAFGLLTLLALTFSFGEAVWASTCPPMPDSGGEKVGTVMVESGASDRHADMKSCHFGSGQSEQDGDRCPLAPAATQGCGAAASLAAPEARFEISKPTGGAGMASGTALHPLLQARTLFHPPRA